MELTTLLSRTPLRRFVPGAQPNRVVLEIDLARGVLAGTPENPLAALRAMNAPTLRVLGQRLREAATDDDVAGLVVHLSQTPISLAQAQELAIMVAGFGESRPTVAIAQSFGELDNDLAGYLVAAHCREVWLQPSGQLGIGGVHLGITLVKHLLQRLGVEPQMSQRHEYKSAAEQLSGDEVSQPNREMVQTIANSITHGFVERVAERRSVPTQQVWDAVNASPLTPEQALAAGLVDHVGYRDEALAQVLGQWQAEAESLRFVQRWSPGGAPRQAAKELVARKQPTVAVVQVRGGIVTGRGRPGGMGEQQAGADLVCEQLRAAARDEQVKAVVLQVDSPGGSAVASDTIWRAVHQVRESGRPVVAQLGDVAASGGYYAAMAADELVALPATLTGSIGVFGGKMVVRGLCDKLSLVHEPVTSGANAGMLAPDSWFTQEQLRRLDAWLDRVYDEFTHKAAADRGMAHETLEPLARGRVWTGSDAQQRGLVDHLGGFELALERACELGGTSVAKARVKNLPAMGSLDRFRPAESTESTAAGASLGLGSRPAGVTGLDELVALAATALGLELPGALALPTSLRLRLH